MEELRSGKFVLTCEGVGAGACAEGGGAIAGGEDDAGRPMMVVRREGLEVSATGEEGEAMMVVRRDGEAGEGAMIVARRERDEMSEVAMDAVERCDGA